MNSAELAFPDQAGAGFPGPHKGDSKAQERATAVGKPALMVPEGGARSLWTAPGVCMVVTQHEPVASPRLHTDPRRAKEHRGHAASNSTDAPPTEGHAKAEQGPLWW